jgi:hypothetical protein
MMDLTVVDDGLSIGNPKQLKQLRPKDYTVDTIPKKVRHTANTAGDSKDNWIVVNFPETELVEEDTTDSIHVWPWVLNSLHFLEDLWHSLIAQSHKIQEWILLEVFVSE